MTSYHQLIRVLLLKSNKNPKETNRSLDLIVSLNAKVTAFDDKMDLIMAQTYEGVEKGEEFPDLPMTYFDAMHERDECLKEAGEILLDLVHSEVK